MPVDVLHVCDKFGVKGSSIHGVSRLFSWWFPRYDPARFRVSLCGLKQREPASDLLASQGIPVHHLGRGRFDPRILDRPRGPGPASVGRGSSTSTGTPPPTSAAWPRGEPAPVSSSTSTSPTRGCRPTRPGPTAGWLPLHRPRHRGQRVDP